MLPIHVYINTCPDPPARCNATPTAALFRWWGLSRDPTVAYGVHGTKILEGGASQTVRERFLTMRGYHDGDVCFSLPASKMFAQVERLMDLHDLRYCVCLDWNGIKDSVIVRSGHNKMIILSLDLSIF